MEYDFTAERTYGGDNLQSAISVPQNGTSLGVIGDMEGTNEWQQQEEQQDPTHRDNEVVTSFVDDPLFINDPWRTASRMNLGASSLNAPAGEGTALGVNPASTRPAPSG